MMQPSPSLAPLKIKHLRPIQTLLPIDVYKRQVLAFDDQCTGANPRYPLVEEIKQLYRYAYKGVDVYKRQAYSRARTNASVLPVLDF